MSATMEREQKQRHSVRCPTCNCADCRTTNTHGDEFSVFGKSKGTRRRRVCRHCGTAFTTFEYAEEPKEAKQEGI